MKMGIHSLQFNRLNLKKKIALYGGVLTLFLSNVTFGQQLIISSSGENGTSGTNWSLTSGTLTVTGTANIHVNVLTTALLNSSVTIEGTTTIFDVTLSQGLTETTSANSLYIGTLSNEGTININSSISTAGLIVLQGAAVNSNASVTTTKTSGSGIEIRAKKITQAANTNCTTLGANILLSALESPFLSTSDYAILINGATTTSKATLNANGGNITLNAAFAPTGISGVDANPDRAISLIWADLLTSGTGTLTLNGDATNNTNTTASAWGIQMSNVLLKTASGAIQLIGTGGKATTNCRGIGSDSQSVKILSDSGAILLEDKKPIGLTGTYNGLYLKPAITANNFIGADGSLVTSSSSSVTITSDKIDVLLSDSNSRVTQINTAGQLLLNSTASSFDSIILTGFQVLGNPSSVTIGKTTNVANVGLATPISASGPITIYAGLLRIENTITSTNTGDITLISNTSNSGVFPSVYIFADILKTGGQRSKLTIRGGGRVQYVENKKIEATNTILDVILWSDFDNSNNDGGTTFYGDITTNGGHVWAGGSNSNGGTSTWNGLTVGDGPSIGTIGSTNWNALDIGANITTSGGSVFLWSGNGYSTGVNGIEVFIKDVTIDTGSGDITLITNAGVRSNNNFNLKLKSTGQVSIAPNASSFLANPFVIAGTLSGNDFVGTTNMNRIIIQNIASVSQLNLGYFTNSNGWNFNNASAISLNSPITNNGSVRINGSTIAINADLKTLTSGNLYLKGHTTIAAGKVIEAAGNFTHDGNLIFKSDATGTAAFGPLGGVYSTISGVVTTERFIPARRAFRFLSSSVTTTSTIKQNWQEDALNTAGLGTHITGTGGPANGFDTTATNNPSLFTFTNGSWAAVFNTNINVLTAGTPYRLMVRGDRTIDLTTNTPTPTATTLRATGTLQTGNLTVNLSSTANDFNFVANPYQAPIYANVMFGNGSNYTNVNPLDFYIWDPSLGSRGAYSAVSISNGQATGGSSHTNLIYPWEAFFIRTSSNGAASITFKEAYKTLPNLAEARTQAADNRFLKLNLKGLQTNGTWNYVDGVRFEFASQFSNEINSEDAQKLINLDEDVAIQKNTAALFSVERRTLPEVQESVSLQVSKYRVTSYVFENQAQNMNGVQAFLKDNYTNTLHELNGTPYPFTVDPLIPATAQFNRFDIVFQPTSLNTNVFDNGLVVYPNPSKSGVSFYVQGVTEAKVTVYNVLGQNIPVRVKDQGNALQVSPLQNTSQGVYLVSITTQGITKQVKWIVE